MKAGTVPTIREVSDRIRRRLLAIVTLLGGLTVIHDLDHVRQGRALPLALYPVAIGALVSIGVTGTVLMRRPEWSRAAALLQGTATLIGVGAVHVAPRWSTITDPYSAAHVDIVSWSIIVAMMLTGLALLVVAGPQRPTGGRGPVGPANASAR